MSKADEPRFDPSRLEVTELVTIGLNRPMELDVAADGRVFFIQLEGQVMVYDPKTASVDQIGELTVTTKQENGLIGLALDPNFAENNHLFLQYSPPDYPGQHISRFTLKNGQVDLESEKLLLKFEEQRKECCHHAGSLEFGPDGCLFIGTGDNTHPGGDSHGYAPIDEREGRGPYDAQKSASNTHGLSGKILRLRPLPDGSCEIPDGNLFPVGSDQGRPEIYVMGCRNPWRLNVDQRTGFLYWGEVGPDARGNGERGPRGYDEINQARQAGNFGWPYFIADSQAYADVDFATNKIGPRYDPQRPINESPNNTGSRELPPAQDAFIYYPYDKSEKFPELGEGGRTACAGPVYHYQSELESSTKFPKHFDNTLFIFEWSRHWIKAVHLNDDSTIERIEKFVPDLKIQRPIDLVFGPDGALYVIEYGETWGVNTDTKILRIDYVRGNRQPVAVAAVENNVGREPLEVRLSSKGSFDKDPDDELEFEWVRVESIGESTKRKTIASGVAPRVTFDQPGVFSVELIVRDQNGGLATATVPVLVGNAKPAVEIRNPIGGFFEPGDPVRFEIVVSDHEDGTSDDNLVDDKFDEIDSDAPSRVSMSTRRVIGKFTMDEDSESSVPLGLKLVKGSDCFNCHDIHKKRVGPPLLEVSKKYRDDPHAAAKSIERVLNGSTGAWGKIPMIPHKQHSSEEVSAMVDWIYSLRADGDVEVSHGFVGEITTDESYSGGLLLEAIYTDRGDGEIPPVTTTVSLPLRSRHVEAEHANQSGGPQTMNSDSADNKQFVGGINHQHFLRFDDIETECVGKVTLRFASAGAGGTIEIRRGKRDGELLAMAEVTADDDWENWREQTVDFRTAAGMHDLFVVFVNEEKHGGLMNLDSMFFHPVER